jgi:S-formylglutathione hydrolase FrmB
VKIAPWVGAILALGLLVPAAPAANAWGGRFLLDRLNRRLHGQVLDFTHNHGRDRRIWSAALHQYRDLYVYLPPGYDAGQQYPAALYLHTFREDEVGALREVMELLDKAITRGDLPPIIVAIPDGSIRGHPTLLTAGSFFFNSKAGAFEDYIIGDVWNFLVEHFPIRPEREAHALIGASMGGLGAFNLAFKHRDMFKIVVGVLPPVNTRWVDCHGRYRGEFDPHCWAWREDFRPCEVVARFGPIPVRMWQLIGPTLGGTPNVIERMAWENPIEMLKRLNLQPGELDMYIAYGGKDQFNIATQVRSFLWVARHRGLEVSVGYDPNGRHSTATAERLFPEIIRWLKPRLGPYAPPP